MEERGVAPCLWLKQWCKVTEKEGCLAFPEHGTFNIWILENVRRVLNELKPPPRPAQFEALAVWELKAIRQQQQKFERRMRKAEKTLVESRQDSAQRVWRRETIDGVRMFPAITQEGETQGGKATCKTDKGSSKEKGTKKSWAEADNSDDDEFLNQLLNDRPLPYAQDDNRPSTSAGPIDSTQNQGTTNTVQVNTVATLAPVQNSVSVPTAPEMQPQLQPPQVQRLYPDVPTLETTTNLMVPADPAYTRPKLIQTEPTPLLLPQVQQQMIPNYTSVTGPQSAIAPGMNQNMGVNAPQGMGNKQTPAAISLPITVGPPVPLYVQAKPSVCEQGVMTQEMTRGGFVGSSQGMTPVEPTFERSRSLLDFSPIGVPLDTMRQSGLGLLTPQISSANVPQTLMMQARNISLQGLTEQQLNAWLDKLNSPQTTPATTERWEREEYLNFVRLGM
ncbi:hypothetical protein NDU88_005897 [Pleurodeles waltl]|uniref:Uncharacterized protein n=1 Tax=Pleurodeles waltl TaxID=8319 RepID=A0AAV7TW32_PLEWA|nr:hypothetical protein NDU88_005897 [Pleurodeles waltl]